MSTRTREQSLIDQLATEVEAIAGIKSTYGFAQNPDTLTNSQMPAFMLFPASFKSELRAHHNVHGTDIVITGVLFVATRSDVGGKLKFLENRTIPFLGKFRETFQTEAVIKRLFNLSNLTKVTDFSGVYGAGGPLLTFNGVEHIGCVFTWTFREII